MNRQKQNGRRGIEWCDYTWNPIRGCLHGCAWDMPDGTTANCYAEDVASRLAQKAYPNGFEHHYWQPDALKEPAKLAQPARIFVGSMADVFGHWVPDEQINEVLQVCYDTPQHTFIFLTKNPKRLRHAHFPPNAWVGISAPPDHMRGKPLTTKQRMQWLNASLLALEYCDARVKWMSIEPLSWDIADHLWCTDENGVVFRPTLHWAVIGAATSGRFVHQPDPQWVRNALVALRRIRAAVFFKGNLKGNEAARQWLEEYPELEKAEV